MTAGHTAPSEAADHGGALPPLEPAPAGADLARRLLSLAATAIQARVPDSAGVAILVWSGGRPDPWLSGGTDTALDVHAVLAEPDALHGVPSRRSLAVLVEACRLGGPAATALIEGRPAQLLAAAGLGDVRSLCAAPVTEVGAVVLAFLHRAPRQADLAALVGTHDLVVDTVRAAAGVRDRLVVPATRLIIEQAKGVLMAHHGLGPDEAFALLRSVSQQRNVPVRDLAHTVVNRRPADRAAAPGSSRDPHVPTA